MGVDKRRLVLDGQTWLERVVGRLEAVVDPVILVLAKGESSVPWHPSERVVQDRVLGEGPLRGLEAGLSALSGIRDAAFVTSCDVPLIRSEVVSRLVSLLDDHHDAVIVRDGGQIQPLCGVYRVALVPTITRALELGERRIYRWLESLRVLWVPGESLRDIDPELESLRDFDTPGDVETLSPGR